MYDQELRKTLIGILANHKNNYIQVIRADKNLMHEIDEAINTDFGLKLKIYWIVNNMYNSPVCPVCGSQMTEKNFININKGYHHFCSVKCMRRSDEYQENYKNTFLQKYDTEREWNWKNASKHA